jgi:hypothetical protein
MSARSVGKGSIFRCFQSLGRGFLFRVLLVVVLVTVTHRFEWRELRFLTSEAVLRLSPALGIPTYRISFDTLRLQGHLFQFVISCTLVDVFIGAIPLIWSVKKSILANASRLGEAALYLFVFNILRLELGHLLYAHGTPWILAHEILGGGAYFAIWLVIWHWHSSPEFRGEAQDSLTGLYHEVSGIAGRRCD